jgi:hypothetical protein
MRNRIRNILIKALILESPLFKAVAVKYDGKVYEGERGDIHAWVINRIIDKFGMEHFEHIHRNSIDGYITLDGKFVDRFEAGILLGYGENYGVESCALKIAGKMQGIKGGIRT